MSCVDDVSANIEAAETAIRKAAKQGAQIICLPELFATKYFCQTEDPAHFDVAEQIPGPTTRRFSALAREIGVVLVVPVFERRAAGIYHNSAAVLDVTGEICGVYRKMHIPDDPQFYEKYYFTPGDHGYVVVDTAFARISVLICWDQWYPEAARLAALGGAQVIFYPTAIGWLASETIELRREQHDAWRTMQRSHAIGNGVFVAAVNRVGKEVIGSDKDGLEFWGRSFGCGPTGAVLAEARDDTNEILLVDCDFDAIEEQRRSWPFLRDRRIDTYEQLTERYLDSGFRSSKS
jgi:N-carbamoylputrescine amidase|tara:strand:- start:23750 stop:24625 length:876 start_codon:yes stop_codon:yes gene_type:complete